MDRYVIALLPERLAVTLTCLCLAFANGRRLVTNLLLQFLTTPRADAKRFEMLSLIASVLQWSDDERETAGLQRNGSGATGRKVGIGAESAGRKSLQDSRSGHGRARAIDGGARDEVSKVANARRSNCTRSREGVLKEVDSCSSDPTTTVFLKPFRRVPLI